MSASRFFYTPEIDKKIPELIKQTLDSEVTSFYKVAEGEENHVFIVTTKDTNVVLRVLGTAANEEKIKFLSKTLTEKKIPFPKFLHVSLTDEYFPYGFMITEFVTGENGKDAIAKSSISFVEFHQRLFKILHQLHKINCDKFGFLEQEGFDTIVDFKIDQLEWCFEQIKEENDIYFRKEEVKNLIKKILTPLQHTIKPVLIHYDPMPSNCIYTTDGKIVLIDWDSAAAECFMRDIAWITYWGSQGEGLQEDRNAILWKLFIEVYQDSGFSKYELQTLEKMYHLLIAVELLVYFLVSQKNTKGYEQTKQRFFSLLQTCKD